MTRRGLLVAAALLASHALPADDEPAVMRVAFGSCAHQDKEQPIWDAVVGTTPEHFVFLRGEVAVAPVAQGLRDGR